MTPITADKDSYKPTDIRYFLDSDICVCGASLKTSADMTIKNGIARAYCVSCGSAVK